MEQYAAINSYFRAGWSMSTYPKHKLRLHFDCNSFLWNSVSQQSVKENQTLVSFERRGRSKSSRQKKKKEVSLTFQYTLKFMNWCNEHQELLASQFQLKIVNAKWVKRPNKLIQNLKQQQPCCSCFHVAKNELRVCAFLHFTNDPA